MEDELDGELRSPFPSPPSHYTKYTTHNLELLKLLKQRTSESTDSELDQQHVLSDQPDVPEWPLTQLEKPRVDWILEEGHYTTFGDVWNVGTSSADIMEHLLDPDSFVAERDDTFARVPRTPPAVSFRS